jgi:hypothetical protein
VQAVGGVAAQPSLPTTPATLPVTTAAQLPGPDEDEDAFLADLDLEALEAQALTSSSATPCNLVPLAATPGCLPASGSRPWTVGTPGGGMAGGSSMQPVGTSGPVTAGVGGSLVAASTGYPAAAVTPGPGCAPPSAHHPSFPFGCAHATAGTGLGLGSGYGSSAGGTEGFGRAGSGIASGGLGDGQGTPLGLPFESTPGVRPPDPTLR